MVFFLDTLCTLMMPPRIFSGGGRYGRMGVKSEKASDVGRDNKTLGPCRRVDWGPGGRLRARER